MGTVTTSSQSGSMVVAYKAELLLITTLPRPVNPAYLRNVRRFTSIVAYAPPFYMHCSSSIGVVVFKRIYDLFAIKFPLVPAITISQGILLLACFTPTY